MSNSIKIFGPALNSELEKEVNLFLRYTRDRILNMKARHEGDMSTIIITFGTTAKHKPRRYEFLRCSADPRVINELIQDYIAANSGAKKVEDTVLVPFGEDEVFIKIIFTENGSHNF